MTNSVHMFAALVALNVADAWSTIYILERKGRELNGWTERLIAKFGLRPAMIGSKLLMLGLAYLGLPWVAQWLLAAAVVAYFAVVANNLLVIACGMPGKGP